MKKSILFLVLFSFPFFSCSRTVPTTPSANEENKQQRLSISSLPTKTNYYVYDKLDLQGLNINIDTYINNSLSSSTKTDSYTLIDSFGNEIKDGDTISDIYLKNGLTLTAESEGCTPISFSLFVDPISNFKQELTLEDNSKFTYTTSDPFSKDDINLFLNISYKTNKKVKLEEKVENFDITLFYGSKKISSLDHPFKETGIYTASIQATGWNDEILNLSYPIYVNSLEMIDSLVNLKQEKDDSIHFEKDSTKFSISFSNQTSSEEKGYFSPSEVTNAYNINEFRKRNIYNWRYLPSKGDVPLLVVPVITPGSQNKATEENWNKINKAFFGNSNELGFESVRSYYAQSSYGQLNLIGGVTNYFDPSSIDDTYSTIGGYDTQSIMNLPQLALNWAKKTYSIDITKYDSDKDGCVDGIWMIYLNSYSSSSADTWWAFTSTTLNTNASLEKPIANNFAWASIDFINGTFSKNDSENEDCDAHVLIHETGHMLGLSDYYTYGKDQNYSPLGTIDMMSQNLIDHNPYSKLLLGWVTPYIATGTGEILLPSDQEKDAVIVFPYDGKKYQKKEGKIQFNVFDEYLVLDYYTYKNLNSHDYQAYSAKTIRENGARIYHVDHRLCKQIGMSSFQIFQDPDDPFIKETNTTLFNLISNTESGAKAESNFIKEWQDTFDEIRWISKDKTKLSSKNKANKNSLFQKGDNFIISDYKEQFNVTKTENKTFYFDIQKDFSTSISFNGEI